MGVGGAFQCCETQYDCDMRGLVESHEFDSRTRRSVTKSRIMEGSGSDPQRRKYRIYLQNLALSLYR